MASSVTTAVATSTSITPGDKEVFVTLHNGEDCIVILSGFNILHFNAVRRSYYHNDARHNSIAKGFAFAEALHANDKKAMEKIINETRSSNVTKIEIKHKSAASEIVWNQHRKDVLNDLIKAYLEQNYEAKSYLLSTEKKKILVRGDNLELFAGPDVDEIKTSNKLPGKNLMGRVLMKIRQDLENEKELRKPTGYYDVSIGEKQREYCETRACWTEKSEFQVKFKLELSEKDTLFQDKVLVDVIDSILPRFSTSIGVKMIFSSDDVKYETNITTPTFQPKYKMPRYLRETMQINEMIQTGLMINVMQYKANVNDSEDKVGLTRANTKEIVQVEVSEPPVVPKNTSVSGKPPLKRSGRGQGKETKKIKKDKPEQESVTHKEEMNPFTCKNCGKTLSRATKYARTRHFNSCVVTKKSNGRKRRASDCEDQQLPEKKVLGSAQFISDSTTCPKCKLRIKKAEREAHFKTHADQTRPKQTENDDQDDSESDTGDQQLALSDPILQSDDEESVQQLYTPMQPARIIKHRSLKSIQEQHEFKLSNIGLERAREGFALEVFAAIIEKLVSKYKKLKHSMLRIVIQAASLETPFSCMFMRADEFDFYSVINAIERLLQSHEEIALDDTIQVTVQVISDPFSGSGRSHLRRKDCENVTKYFIRKRSVLSLAEPDENRCLYLAVIMALRVKEAGGQKESRRSNWYRRGGNVVYVRKEVDKLIIDTGGSGDKPARLAEIEAVQKYLNMNRPTQLVVFNGEQENEIAYRGLPERSIDHKIFLVLTDNHFQPIVNLKGFLCARYTVCQICLKSVGLKHRCIKRCARCRSPMCKKREREDNATLIECINCHLYFFDDFCLQQHITRHECVKKRQCERCERPYPIGEKHNCTQFMCSRCNENVDYNHLCFTTAVKTKRISNFRLVFFDIETYAINTVHVPYLVVAEQCCRTCVDDLDCTKCTSCGERTHVFFGQNCMTEFVDWLLSVENRGAVCLSFNGSAYDSYFVLAHFVRTNVFPSVVVKGSRFLSIKIGNAVEFKDVYQFMFCKLSMLPKIFEFEGSKGYWPHFFSSPEHLDYIGSRPEPHFYGVDAMSVTERVDFFQWYDTVKSDVFNFRAEAISYCTMDTRILRKGAQSFRKIIHDYSGIEVWHQCLTLSHLATVIYRNCHMPFKTLGIVPNTGYTSVKSTSVMAIKYLEWLKMDTGMQIIHGGESLEKRYFARYPSDGAVYEAGVSNSNGEPLKPSLIFDIRGCFYHAHSPIDCSLESGWNKRVYDLNQRHPLSGMTVKDIIDRDTRRLRVLKQDGIHVQVVYECEIYREIDQSQSMKLFWNDGKRWENYLVTPITPREALFGGRCGVTAMYRELTDDEITQGYRMHMGDIRSLYPHQMRSNKFNFGHPEILKGTRLPSEINLSNIDDYFGLLKVRVLPPSNLMHGVVPCRANGRLTFTLCHQCAVDFPNEDPSDTEYDQIGNVLCTHSEDQRSFWVVLCQPELKLALEYQYKVIVVSEIWKYDTTYSLFDDYVNTMMQMKQENSGYPESVITEEQRVNYIAEMAADKVILRPEHIKKCNGMKAIGKGLLNSLWGKLAQNPERTHHVYIRTPKQLSDLIRDTSSEITECVFLPNNVLSVSYRNKLDYSDGTNSVYNPVTGALVACYGRIALYELIGKHPNECYYTDTDSELYICPPGGYEAPLGEKIGDLTSQCAPGDFIRSFVATGPKSYSYVTMKGEVVTKAKGLTLRGCVNEIISFEQMREIVLGRVTELDRLFYARIANPEKRKAARQAHSDRMELTKDKRPFLVLPYDQMKRDKHHLTIRNTSGFKILRTTGELKRRILPQSLRTVEFGYRTPDDPMEMQAIFPPLMQQPPPASPEVALQVDMNPSREAKRKCVEINRRFAEVLVQSRINEDGLTESDTSESSGSESPKTTKKARICSKSDSESSDCSESETSTNGGYDGDSDGGTDGDHSIKSTDTVKAGVIDLTKSSSEDDSGDDTSVHSSEASFVVDRGVRYQQDETDGDYSEGGNSESDTSNCKTVLPNVDDGKLNESDDTSSPGNSRYEESKFDNVTIAEVLESPESPDPEPTPACRVVSPTRSTTSESDHISYSPLYSPTTPASSDDSL